VEVVELKAVSSEAASREINIALLMKKKNNKDNCNKFADLPSLALIWACVLYFPVLGRMDPMMVALD